VLKREGVSVWHGRVHRIVKELIASAAGSTFTLRGIKESPPYLHDGRCLTPEDAVEFFNIVLRLKLNQEEKHDLVAFMWEL
jgi:cytochrome c peroxidase